jgi:hypothetical protein
MFNGRLGDPLGGNESLQPLVTIRTAVSGPLYVVTVQVPTTPSCWRTVTAYR